MPDIQFEGLNPDENRRLNDYAKEVLSAMCSYRPLGTVGRPYRHQLADDIASSELMKLHLVEVFSCPDGSITAEITYEASRPVIEITQRVGM